MKVLLLRDIACPLGSFKQGHEIELPKHMAEALLEGGYAKLLTEMNATKQGAETTDLTSVSDRAMAVNSKGAARKGR